MTNMDKLRIAFCLDCEYPFSTQVDVDYSDVELGDECDDCTIVDEE